MHRRLLFLILSLALVAGLTTSPSLLADGTQVGSIGGVVRDAGGGPLAGAAVTAKGVKTGFRRDTVTGSDGSFTLRQLPIGDYVVDIAFSGFQSANATATVQTDKRTELNVALKLSNVVETVSVTADVPVIDKTQTASGATVNASFTQKLAVGRSYQSLIQLSPGVTGGANPNVRGALNSNNVFLFDGVDTTDTTTGTFGQNFNFEAIQEVAINTGGYSAEYGRASGGVVSVVTKSGTNQFHGSAKVLATNDRWDAQNTTKNQVTGASLARTKFDEIQYREAFTLGGPVLKDQLWFFGAYEYAKATTPQRQTLRGQEYQQATKTKLWSGKISWQASPSHSFEVSGSGDPIDGFVVDYWGASADLPALTGQDQGGKTWRFAWNGIFSPSLSAEATVATSESRIDVGTFNSPSGAPFYTFGGARVATSQLRAPHFNNDDGFYYNGATFVGFVERPRTQFNIAASYYARLGGMNHGFKAGVDYQSLKSDAQFAYPDNAVYTDDGFDLATRQFIPNALQIFDAPVLSRSKGKVWGFYALDRIDWGRLFLNIGFRVDVQDGSSDLGATTFDKTVFSPRLHAKYDVLGNGKTLVSAGYGRYYQSVNQGFSDGFAGIPQQTNNDLYIYNPATGRYDFDIRTQAGGNDLPVNLALKPSYSDDVTMAFEQRLGPEIGVSVRGTYRKWNDLIDDVKFFDAAGNRVIRYENYEPAARKYRGLEITLDKRFSRNFQVLASYTLSRTEGNHFVDTGSALGDYLTRNSTTAGLNGLIINEVNKYGRAAYDRTHDFKAYGSYSLPLGIVTLIGSPTVGYRSGTTYQRQANRALSGVGGTFTQFVTPRGSDRFPSQFYLDFSLQADVKIYKDMTLGLKGESFNLTNRQDQTGGSLTNNANYGKATARSQYATPRTFRLTALLTF